MRPNWFCLRGGHLIVLCLFLLQQMGCSKADKGFDGTDESLDSTPPFAITDLTVTDFTVSSVSLRWTATGDDHDTGTGTAALYDLRYSFLEITNDCWDSATVVPGLISPGPPRLIDSITVASLLEDSTYYFAIKAADELGNWSNLSNVVNAACINDFAVTIADTAMERVIRFYINKPDGAILRSDMLQLWKINATGQRIYSLSGLENCGNLYTLILWNNHVTDLSPLEDLGKLRVLNVGFNGLSDLTPLAALAGLDTLQLNSNHIEDLSALAGLEDLSCLELSWNAIGNLAPLTGKTTIRHLNLDGNQIVFVNALYNLTGLATLRLSNNQITDILPLASNPGLGAGDTIWLSNNPLTASSTDSLIAVLLDRGATIIR